MNMIIHPQKNIRMLLIGNGNIIIKIIIKNFVGAVCANIGWK